MHVYCLNLERRTDRRRQIEKEFTREMLDVEFVNATDGCKHSKLTKGECGCADSHIRVWRDIVDKGYPMALVFEDDARLVPNFKEKLDKVIQDLPNDWDVVNLGSAQGGRIKQKKISKHLVKGRSLMTHCYLISQKAARHMSHWSTRHLKYPIDGELTRAPIYMLYTYEPLAKQCMTYPFVCMIKSSFEGDIGIFRSIYATDLDFVLRLYWPVILLVMFICTRIRLFGA